MAAYLAAMSRWLFDKPIEVEIGWGLTRGIGDPERVLANLGTLAAQGVSGVRWLSLVDPRSTLQTDPPWSLCAGLEQVGLLDHHLEPKEHSEGWIRQLHPTVTGGPDLDFIDVDEDEYRADPSLHLPRLWHHFRESC